MGSVCGDPGRPALFRPIHEDIAEEPVWREFRRLTAFEDPLDDVGARSAQRMPRFT